MVVGTVLLAILKLVESGMPPWRCSPACKTDHGDEDVQGNSDREGRSRLRAAVKDIDEAQLPEGDVTVRVERSSLNYKDGLAITGKGPVVRKFPMVPGIDIAGTVEASDNPDYKAGDRVVLNGWGVGETHWGGLAQKARLKGDWLVPLPDAFTAQQAVAIGTAGYTAMLCVLALERMASSRPTARSSSPARGRRGQRGHRRAQQAGLRWSPSAAGRRKRIT